MDVEDAIGVQHQIEVLVETVEDVANLEPRDPHRLAFITQTTLSVNDTDITMHPSATGSGVDGFDIAVIELPEIAPGGSTN